MSLPIVLIAESRHSVENGLYSRFTICSFSKNPETMGILKHKSLSFSKGVVP